MNASEETPLRPEVRVSAGTFAPREGLSSKEAAARLRIDGPNKLELADEEPFISIFVTQMKSTIFLLTMVAAVVSRALGNHSKPYMLLTLVVFVCFAKAYGEYSGQNAGRALEGMTASTALVLRDDREQMISQEELVIGDVVKLKDGDMVPADMVVLESIDLQANESLLTGEPHEQRKTVEPLGKESAFPSNMLYKGTGVVGGHGKGEVAATGMKTQVGLIAKRLQFQEVQELSPLQQSINLLGVLIGMLCVFVVLISTAIAYGTSFNDPSDPCVEGDNHCLLLSSIERGLMMAVAVIPHGLPFVVMVMMRVGADQMKQQNAFLTRQSAVDYLGATSVICTDKTGTLTEGKMTTKRLFGLCASADTSSDIAESSLDFYPLRGLSPNGGLFCSKDLTSAAKQRMDAVFDSSATRQSFAETNLPDLAEASQSPNSIDGVLARAHLTCGFLTSRGASLAKDPDSGQWVTAGNMTEVAVKVSAAKGGLWDHEGRGAQLLKDYTRDENLEIPFTSSRKMMATIHKLDDTCQNMLECLKFTSQTTHIALLKGAPDRLTKCLQQIPLRDGHFLVVPGRCLSQSERTVIEQRNAEFAGSALRSLLVAVCPLDTKSIESLKIAKDADARLKMILSHTALCFLSLWGIYDPPRAMVTKSVEECRGAGIQVVMITGDQHATAVAVGQQIGLFPEGDENLHAAECFALQETLPSMLETKRLSGRASQLIEAGHVLSLQRRPSKESASMVKPRGSRRLSVHDPRNAMNQHEPTYKSEEALADLTSRIWVWARAQPSDKVAIVESLRRQDHITVMTGDGVNDAPALKHAHTGVAMGMSGTEVTKNASSLILLDDDFSTIVAAVREGRRIYSNTQKYVLFNFCIKEGELLCVLFAIIFRIPVPIEGVKQLMNMYCTHIVPPLVLAYETPEPQLMELPPRETKRDFILTPLMMLLRFIPYVFLLPVGVLGCTAFGLWSHTGYVSTRAVVGSSQVGLLDEGLVACEYAGILTRKKVFITDSAPFHCKCHDRWRNPPHQKVEQWGVSFGEKELLAKFDRWTGNIGNLYEKSKTPWAKGVGTHLVECLDASNVRHWCWKDNQALRAGRPLLSSIHNCAAYGSRFGQTMGYTSIQMSEILSLMCFRRNESVFPHLFSNMLYVYAVIFNLIALTIFLYVPMITDRLKFAPLDPLKLLLVMIFPIVFCLVNEATKTVYRKRLESQQEALKGDRHAGSTPAVNKMPKVMEDAAPLV